MVLQMLDKSLERDHDERKERGREGGSKEGGKRNEERDEEERKSPGKGENRWVDREGVGRNGTVEEAWEEGAKKEEENENGEKW